MRVAEMPSRALKNAYGAGLFAIGALFLFSQQTHEVRVTNVEIPVRVFRGEAVVPDLTRADFEVLEDGVSQDIEAVYFIENAAVRRKEEKAPLAPVVSRHFYLFFYYFEYEPKIREAVALFINDVVKPGDTLTIVTPARTMVLSEQIRKRAPKARLVEDLNKQIRKDILAGDAAYRAVLNDLKRMVVGSQSVERPMARDDEAITDAIESGLANSAEELFFKYEVDLDRLENLRTWDEKKLIDFAVFLKTKTGQKLGYFFYQREFIPIPDKNVMAILEKSLLLKQMATDLFGLFRRRAIADIARLREAFVDSGMTVHFLYLTKSPNDVPLTQVVESSQDVYRPLSQMAKATGGIVSSSSDSAYLMEKASQASTSYYLLYYTPKNAKFDGAFRKIEVRVKGTGLTVAHKEGYFAR